MNLGSKHWGCYAAGVIAAFFIPLSTKQTVNRLMGDLAPASPT